MSIITLLLPLLATAASDMTKVTTTISTGGHDWLPTIGGILIALITAIFSWWSNRPKNRGDQFKVFMDESAEFREEMRKEKESLKIELKDARGEIESLYTRVRDYQKKVEVCNRQLEKCQRDLLERNTELELFRAKVAHLKDEVSNE